MARTQARILCTIWTDPDWRPVPRSAKYTYLLLLSQPRLSLAGCIDLMPRRWADHDPDVTEQDVLDDLDDLQQHRLVVVDVDTEELLIRSFAKNDVAIGSLNGNLLKGYWSAWQGIMSAALRKVVVDNTPDALWSFDPKRGPEVRAPDNAWSARLEPPFEPPFGQGLERRFQPPTPLPTPLPTPTPPPTPLAREHESHSPDQPRTEDQARPVDVEPSKRQTPADRTERARAALNAFTDAAMARREAVGEPIRERDAYRAALHAGTIRDHHDRATQLAGTHPDWSPERIADELGRRGSVHDDSPSPKALHDRADQAYRARRNGDGQPLEQAAHVDHVADARRQLEQAARREADGHHAQGGKAAT